MKKKVEVKKTVAVKPTKKGVKVVAKEKVIKPMY